jgi:hypothetical protein
MDYHQYLNDPRRAFERRVVNGYESNWLTADAEAAVSEEAFISACELEGPNSAGFSALLEKKELELTEELCDAAASLTY